MFFIFYKGEFISFWATGKFETSAYLGSTEAQILFGITYEESLLWDLRISLWVGLPVLQLHLIQPRRLCVKLARFNYDVLSFRCVRTSTQNGYPSTDSGIELYFVPRKQTFKCQQPNIVIITLCVKVFYFLDLWFLEPYSGFEPETSVWKTEMLPVTPIGQYLPSWI